MGKRLLTTSQLAARFNRAAKTVRRWIAEGRIIPTLVTPGGQYLFDPSIVDAFKPPSDETH